MNIERVINARVEPRQGKNSIEDLGFLNIKDVADYLKVRRSTIYNFVEQKSIPHYRLGRQIRFRKEDIDRWMAGQKQEVIDTKVEANKIFKPIERKGGLDVGRIIKKAIEGAFEKRYTSSHGKPDHKGPQKGGGA